MWKGIVFSLAIISIATLGSVALIAGHNGAVLAGCLNAIGLVLVYFIGFRNGKRINGKSE